MTEGMTFILHQSSDLGDGGDGLNGGGADLILLEHDNVERKVYQEIITKT